jgi:hypothetical protein
LGLPSLSALAKTTKSLIVKADRSKFKDTLENMSHQELVGQCIIMTDSMFGMLDGSLSGLLEWVKKQEKAREKYTK